MAQQLSVALVGIGGYGNNYVNPLLDAPDAAAVRIAGAVDPAPERCRRLADLRARGVPVYPSMEAFYAADRADLTLIATPIHLHADQTCLALAHGSHVLCEKPLCATADEARRMREARDRAGRQVAIGYQWSFSRAIQSLKADVAAGVLGRPLRLRTLVLWPRDETYYARTRWAGVKRDAHGRWVLDSPVSNACAHYLHNMLYVIGPSTDRSASPARVRAELYRAHPIENYDTAAVRVVTTDGAELLLVASHATAAKRGPVFRYEFARGVVEFADEAGAVIEARLADGTVKRYGSPNERRDEKIWQTVDAVRHGRPTVCGIEAAAAHTCCVGAAQRSMPEITPFPAPLVHVDGPPGHRRTWVDGLDDVLARCYDDGRLPSELGADWARPADEVTVDADCS